MAIADPIDACRFWLHDTTAPTTFTDAQIQEFLDLEKVIDSDGYEPLETGWTPTYDVLRAAGRGWMWLAGNASGTLGYRVGDVQVQYDRTYCLQRARELMGAASGTAQRRDEQTDPDVLARYREEP
jgi:hypothetical protein